MSYRVDRSPKVATKMAPMYSPRIDGGGVFASRVMPPSPLSKGLEGPVGSPRIDGGGAFASRVIPPSPLSKGLEGPVGSPVVDYDDVFGGPPKFAPSMLATQAGQASSATFDRSTARTPSFRSPSFPVFELPVFGDDVCGSSNTFEPRPASVTYDDIFREEVHTPDVYAGSCLYGNIPRSKAPSRSSSRRMSPVHPAASLPDQLLQEEILAAANLSASFKDRSSAWKIESRNSFSSPSFDEGKSSMGSRKDTAGLSLPSSPPHTNTSNHVKRFMASKIANNLASSTDGDVDDVFGGFPQRTYSPVFVAAHYDTSNPSRTHIVPTKVVAENKPPRSPFTSQSSQSHEGLSHLLLSSSSSNGEQELLDDFIEIRMDRQRDSAPEKVEAAAGKMSVTVSDLKLSAQSTPKKASVKPPPSPSPAPAPAPAAQLKHKSWKDWTSDLAKCQQVYPGSSASVKDASTAIGGALSKKKDVNNGNTMYHHNKEMVESRSVKQLEINSAARQPQGKYTLSSPLKTALKAKPLEETMELEERELQAILNNAWKINEKRERKKIAAARPAQELPNVSDSKLQEPLVKEGQRQPSKLPKALTHQQGSQKIEDTEADLHWKSWTKRSGKERTESTKIGLLHESKLTKAPSYSAQDVFQERVENPAMLNALSEAEDSFDLEEIVKVVTEEGQRQPSKLPKALNRQQGSQKIEDREANLHWKSWTKHSGKERTESTKISLLHESKLTKAPSYNAQDVFQERVENPAMLNALSEAEDSFDPEEIVKVVTEEVSANGSIKDSDRRYNVGGINMKSDKKEVKSLEISGNGKVLKVSKDENEAASARSSTNSFLQDFVQCSEQQEVIVNEGVEEIDLLIGLDATVEGFQDIEGESLERRKARWVRHLRSKERVAKALEEMQQRDAEVQREQKEKQQLAESADRQIKHWVTGKEGNLRALLSNLQHVLWPESGWQPISLADLIEGSDVKKAYRKATLFVHPDKVQQKGATLQQKYIAERVFDILQEAWKTFNLQELF